MKGLIRVRSVYLQLIILLAIGSQLYSGTAILQYGDDLAVDCTGMRFENDYGSPVYWSYGDSEIGLITYFWGVPKWFRYYYKCPIPDFLYQHSVDSAFISIHTIERTPYQYDSDQPYTLTINSLSEALTQDFENAYGSGHQSPEYALGDHDTSFTHEHDYVGWIKFDITNLVNSWLSFESENNGIVFRMLEESEYTQQQIYIASSSNSNTRWPKIEIYGEIIPDTLLSSAFVEIDQQIQPPETFRLSSFPNPFNPKTTIRYEIPYGGLVEISIFDVRGEIIKQLSAKHSLRGTYEVHWDGKDENGNTANSGIYFCKIQTGKNSRSIKLTLLK